MGQETGWNKPEITDSEVKEALEFCCEQAVRNLDQFTEKFPKAYSEQNFYLPVENTDWTTGFWTGELWLAYEASGKECLRTAAEIQVESFYHRIQNKISVDHHDMGFLYTPSCVASYRLTGNKRAKEAALLAAEQLFCRYRPKGKFIQAWGSMSDPESCRLIIDCLLNVPLLFWASEETKDTKYQEAAINHIQTALTYVVREDASTWHTYYFNPETGEPVRGATCQGYRDGSAWARGQAWGIYGLALAYRAMKKEDYLQKFRDVTGYFLKHLPEDLVPYWDLEFTSGTEQPRDSSSASIAACGMLEMSNYLEQEEAENYIAAAKQILKSVFDHYAVKKPEESNGLVLHSTYSNHSPYNTCNHCGVDECNIWGDYFYMEALTRLKTDWKPYW